MQKRRKYNEVTPSGLGIFKNGRLQVPVLRLSNNDKKLNQYFQPLPEIGEYIISSNPGFITKKSIGKVVGIDRTSKEAKEKGHILRVDFIDGSYGTPIIDQVYVLNSKEMTDIEKILNVEFYIDLKIVIGSRITTLKTNSDMIEGNYYRVENVVDDQFSYVNKKGVYKWAKIPYSSKYFKKYGGIK